MRKNTSQRRVNGLYITSIISISLVLFLIGLMILLILNSRKLSTYVRENIGFSLFLKQEVKEIEIKKLQKFLDASNFVKETQHISKEEAAKGLQKELGEDFIHFLGYNPLLPSIDLKLKAQYTHTDSINKIEKELLTYPQISEVSYQKSLVHLINENVRSISFIFIIFTCLLLLVAIVLINNTVRASIYSQRITIKTMQLVGATRGFIRKPFLYRSVGTGIFATLLALLLIGLFIYYIQKEFYQIIRLYDVDILAMLALILILLGIIITNLATWISVNKYLTIRTEKLY